MAYTDIYGALWSGTKESTDALQIELRQIRLGKNLFQHYRNAITLIRPNDDHHRWSDKLLESFIKNDITVIIGCKDSGKTNSMTNFVVVDYLAFPEKTLWMISTTEGRGSELRIWGSIKDFFNDARKRFDIQGNPIDYLKTITTDDIDEERELARSLRRGIIVIPCKTGGLSSGLAPYMGIKAPRLRHCGDEVSAMNEAYLNAYSNWHGKADFKGIMAGNFMETDDPLGIASEPEDGWDSFVDNGKTQEWTSRFYEAHVIALDGRDSPNFDYPAGDKIKFPYLINQKGLDGTAKTHGMDSWQWHTFCVGKPAKGMDIWRVLTKSFCEKHHALEDVVWKHGTLVHIYGLDPAYGEGDRCVGREVKFGEDIHGVQIISIGPPEIVPISISSSVDAEEQIAIFVADRLKQLGIQNKNCFFDSFGRGTLSFKFSKIMGADTPIPVNSSDTPSKRPVRYDLFTEDRPGSKRLKRCDEYYIKFISELWFSVREAIESEQVRNLDYDTIREGQSRKFTNVNGKIEVEPKHDMKKRLGKSPDKMDNLAICIEGARQRGFKILRIGQTTITKAPPDWLDLKLKNFKELNKSKQLQRV